MNQLKNLDGERMVEYLSHSHVKGPSSSGVEGILYDRDDEEEEAESNTLAQDLFSGWGTFFKEICSCCTCCNKKPYEELDENKDNNNVTNPKST